MTKEKQTASGSEDTMKSNKVVLQVLGYILDLLLMVLVVFIILQLGTAAYHMGYRIFTESAVEAAPGRDVRVKVEEGMSAKELGMELEEKQLVEDHTLFYLQLKISAYANKIKPGLYTLNTSMNAEEMMQIMAREEIEETEE